ncbi:MAG TPA: ABC transporter substrate binding protein [Tepidisphaeraceae bacterium]|nr:ABC transporter substrate binding protein [Tepidisphaeraceae bacterium]
MPWFFQSVRFRFGVIGLALCWLAATPAKAAHVLIVKASEAEPYTQAETALRNRLVELHHDVRSAVIKELEEKGVAAGVGNAQVVVAVGTPSARWLHKQLPANVRLVYCMVTNVENTGLLSGAESWGVTTDVTIAEQIRIISEALPRARVLGMLYRSDTPDARRGLEAIEQYLPPTWRLAAVAVNEHPSMAAAIDALIQKNVDVIWTTADQKVYDTASVRALLLAGLRGKIPVWGYSPPFVRAGALLGVGVEPRGQGAQAAEIVERLLAGQAGGADKAQPPREFQVAVNLIVAKQLGLEIPESLTRRAAYVFRPEN